VVNSYTLNQLALALAYSVEQEVETPSPITHHTFPFTPRDVPSIPPTPFDTIQPTLLDTTSPPLDEVEPPNTTFQSERKAKKSAKKSAKRKGKEAERLASGGSKLRTQGSLSNMLPPFMTGIGSAFTLLGKMAGKEPVMFPVLSEPAVPTRSGLGEGSSLVPPIPNPDYCEPGPGHRHIHGKIDGGKV
jgi:hypothetical protein